MILGALIDVGVPLDVIRANLDRLPLDGWTLEGTPVEKGTLRATQVVITVDDDNASRNYAEIVTLLRNSALEENVRRRSLETFEILAQAEAKVHDRPVDRVHFHEVGGTDALIDIVGACAALEHLAPTRTVTGPIATGSGFVSSDHGQLPLPAPAVTEILKGAVLHGRGEGELVTPTGAAILAAASQGFGPLPFARLRSTGYGAGQRDLDPPNVLRVLVADENVQENDSTVVLETNLDDMSPELLPHLLDTLIGAGAQDAWLTPILMKKGRPGFLLSVLTTTYESVRLLEIIYRESSTFGVRKIDIGKDVLRRQWVTVDVAGQKVSVKIGLRGSKVTTVAPEYEDARRAAAVTGIPLKTVFEAALKAARSQSA